jgi:general stress protein 26
MAELTIQDISNKMKKIDICMMTTRNSVDMLESRPMSNNRDVEYEGESFFFTLDTMPMVRDLKAHPQVCLAFEEYRHLSLGHHRLYITVSGEAELIRDRHTMERHWKPELDKWFDKGIDTPGLTLIQVNARQLKYWDGMDHGEVMLADRPQRLAS